MFSWYPAIYSVEFELLKYSTEVGYTRMASFRPEPKPVFSAALKRTQFYYHYEETITTNRANCTKGQLNNTRWQPNNFAIIWKLLQEKALLVGFNLESLYLAETWFLMGKITLIEGLGSQINSPINDSLLFWFNQWHDTFD